MPRSMACLLAAEILLSLCFLIPLPWVFLVGGQAVGNLYLFVRFLREEQRLRQEVNTLVAARRAEHLWATPPEVPARLHLVVSGKCGDCNGTGHGCYRPDCDCTCATCRGSGKRFTSPRANA